MVFQVDQFILSISLTLKYMYFTYIKYQYRAKNNFLSSGEKTRPPLWEESRSFTNAPSAVPNQLADQWAMIGCKTILTLVALIRKICGADTHLSLMVDKRLGGQSFMD